MMHITEDTPPDMLVGAMDLTVHLPNGRSVKMSVERRLVYNNKLKRQPKKLIKIICYYIKYISIVCKFDMYH